MLGPGANYIVVYLSTQLYVCSSQQASHLWFLDVHVQKL
uniref:Uncharacterized protein n=1 Tax=Arundo donax TaxID=35708 RepID=A0A0A9AHI2_ARUDO